jgi:transcription initiation factor TFIID TATA-box-binding protein
MINLRIVNVVATANLNQEIDFEKLREEPEVFHDSDVYGGRVAYYKDNNMQGRVSIFCSGKLISVGTRNEEQAWKELEYVAKSLTEKGLINQFTLAPKTQNIVVSGDLGKAVDFEKLIQNPNVVYEPEQFPASIVHLLHPYKATVLVFASGKIVINGLKTSSQIEQVVEELQRIIES